MRRLIVLLLLGCIPLSLLAQPTTREEQRVWLLQQIRLGEATHRETLVEDSLARLRLLEPDNLDAISAAIRQALRSNELERAQKLFGDLQRIAPGSQQEQQMARLLQMHSGDGWQTLQQIRLLAAAGRFDEAFARYEAAFGSEPPPSLELALEYWRVRSHLPDQLPITIAQLQKLDSQYPGSPELQKFLVEQLFRAERNDEAMAVIARMADDRSTRRQAAELEYGHLLKLPVSDASVRAWQAFLARYPDDEHVSSVEELLGAQQALTGDPAWRAGREGIALLDQQRSPALAERKLRQALAASPNDATLKGYLGLALARQDKREEAVVWLQQAAAEEKDTRVLRKWHALSASTQYWLLLQRGKQALAARNYAAAQRYYQQAAQLDANEVQGVLGLGNVALAQGRKAQAETYYRRALQIRPGNDSAIRALAGLYREQSPQRYDRFVSGLPAKQRQALARASSSGGGDPQLTRLRNEAQQAMQRKDWPAASSLLRQARQRAPDDPWLAADLARALRMQNRTAEADAVFADLLSRQSGNPQARFAYALHLESSDRPLDAQQSLQAVPVGSWSEGMHQLQQRLQRKQLLARAEALNASGDFRGAEALLEQRITASSDAGQQLADLRQLAGWARQREDLQAADRYYARMLALQPEDGEARLGRIEAQIDRGEIEAAHQALRQSPPDLDGRSSYVQRRLANAWLAVGEPDKALSLLAELARQRSEPDAQLYRDLAQLQAASDVERALDYYALGMRDAGLLTPGQASPRDDIALTTASRAKDDEGWLPRSLRRGVDSLYQWKSPTVTVHQDYGWRDNDGAEGISDLTTFTTMVHAEMPIATGRGFARVEQVALRASSFDADADGLHRESFGSCSFRGTTASGPVATGCPDGAESADGTTLALGWQGDRLSADIGTSPLGFEEQNILGGVTYSGKTWGTGWSLTASRRPMNNSLLSYAGARDPRTGVSWGGVTANGLTLGLSRDQGGDDGIWASLGYHLLRGENVVDNKRLRAMSGYYYRLINRVDEQLRVGASAMYWTYDRNLGGYTLGQGGYYSPQRYVSLGLPANYAWRNADWSVYLEGSLGYSWSSSDAERVFPLDSANDDILAQYDSLLSSNIGATRGGGDSSGLGYRFEALAERRLDDHWVLGGGFTAQRSEDYAPNRVLLYLRYSFDVWQGNLPLPVNPLKPYADFR